MGQADIRLRWYNSPPRWFINHRWSAPDRMAARIAGQVARAEHRAGLMPDVDPPTFQHRQGCFWEWN
ncbi:hypothetical protein ACWDV4_23535 [Micromonospora sp. NPDC003197]